MNLDAAWIHVSHGRPMTQRRARRLAKEIRRCVRWEKRNYNDAMAVRTPSGAWILRSATTLREPQVRRHWPLRTFVLRDEETRP